MPPAPNAHAPHVRPGKPCAAMWPPPAARLPCRAKGKVAAAALSLCVCLTCMCLCVPAHTACLDASTPASMRQCSQAFQGVSRALCPGFGGHTAFLRLEAFAAGAAMSVIAHPRFTVRNTFLSAALAEPLARRSGRSHSMPPPSSMRCTAAEDEVHAKQLARLNAMSEKSPRAALGIEPFGASSTTCGAADDGSAADLTGAGTPDFVDDRRPHSPLGSAGYARELEGSALGGCCRI